MTEPDGAILWARERMATRCDEDGFPEVAEAYRRGDRDEFLRDDIEAYRAGAAASAARIKPSLLEARVAELERHVNTLRRVVGTDKIVPLLKESDQ